MRGYPHHIQSPMGGSSHDPKFPQSSDDYQNLHHHNGYVHNGAVGSNMLSIGNDYSNLYHQSNGIHTNANNYNYSDTGHFYQQNGSYSSQMHSTTNSGFQTNNNGYYSGYYSAHQMMDFPIQCPNSEPTNTVLGLQELGRHQMPHLANQSQPPNVEKIILGLKLERRIEEAVPAGQQLQELGRRLRCDDSGSDNVSVQLHREK